MFLCIIYEKIFQQKYSNKNIPSIYKYIAISLVILIKIDEVSSVFFSVFSERSWKKSP
jgi:hypothetical protein